MWTEIEQQPMTTSRGPRDALFNGHVDARAATFVPCHDEAMVQAAVRRFADAGTPIAVVGGGHDMWGRGLVEGNAVLDLATMCSVTVAADAGEVTFGGGALAGDLLAALPPTRAVATGTILSVGMTGLTLGGGYGFLTSRFGLASDNLRSARVVLADGSLVEVDDAANADLLWALRGGGSGFGVVTRMTVAMHDLPCLLATTVYVPLGSAANGLDVAQRLIDAHPVDLGIFSGFMLGPDGQPTLFLSAHWFGAIGEGRSVFDRLGHIAGSQAAPPTWKRFAKTFDPEVEKAFPKGGNYRLLTRTLARLDEAAIDILVDGASAMRTAGDAILLHDFHGTPALVDPAASAFHLRDDHFVVEVIAGWPRGAPKDPEQLAWAERLTDRLGDIAMPGGYASLLPPSDGARVRDFYGPNADRLREVKRRVDPHDLFRSGIGRLVGGD